MVYLIESHVRQYMQKASTMLYGIVYTNTTSKDWHPPT
jgi:hypothetical protein